jgi:hypothetical protein
LVYSLLGTTGDIWKATIQPDYQKPFQVVYTETAVLIIQSSSALSVFREVDSAVLPCSLLPSWCPDWRYPYHTEQHWSLTGLSFGFDYFFRACGSATATAKLCERRKQLTLRGIALDTISANQSDACEGGWLGWALQLLLDQKALSLIYEFTGQSNREALTEMMSGVSGRRTNANFAGIDKEKGNQQRKDPDRTFYPSTRRWRQIRFHW